MNKLLKTIPYIIISVLVGVTVVYAGSLTPPGSPAKSMKSLADLYELVNTGANTPSTDFTTPFTIATTMTSLGDSYDLLKTKITAIDSTKVLSGTTIFGKVGAMTDNTSHADFAPTTTSVAIPTGFYDGVTKVLGDANLIASNIKSGTTIFGIGGSLITTPTYGDNVASKVLNTASNPGTYDVNTCSITYNTVNLSDGTVKSGTAYGNSSTGNYPSATYPLPGDTGTTDATNTSILSGFESWSKSGSLLTGSAILALGDAINSNVLAGKYFSNGTTSNVLGTMVDRGATSYTPSNVAQTISAGYYNGSGSVATDANLIASNIKSGTTIFGVPGSLTAGTNYSLPKTGQTGCWNEVGTSIPCTGTGQDGDTLKGFTGTRFSPAQPSSSVTITDNATGLVWQKCSPGLSGDTCGTGTATTYTWANALTYCNTLSLDGSGWRLPNRLELSTIVNLQTSSPAIDTTFFPGTQSNFYWSSTTSAAVSTTYAWYVDFDYGSIRYNSKTNPYDVRCVRG